MKREKRRVIHELTRSEHEIGSGRTVKFRVSSWIVLVLCVLAVRAQSVGSPPRYQAEPKVDGVIRIWGDEQMETVMKRWQSGFRKQHPSVRFETKLLGTGTGMAGLYSGVADIAVLGRDATSSEVMAFEWVFKYKPQSVQVATGSLDVPGKTFAIGVLVNKDNPLTKLTLTQLDAIFGTEHRRGARNIRTWGDLGLMGEWKDKPINVYGYDTETNTGSFFKRAVLNGSDKWNCDLREFADSKQPNGSQLDAGQRISEALAHDRYGIAYGNLRYVDRQVKPVALSLTDEGPFYEATKENLIQRKYPLTRAVSFYVNRAPGQPLDPKVKEFLRYILSQEGQQEVGQDRDFMKLSDAREQLRKLE
jgi:phosphate transport system substrate-binding protein